MDIRKAITRFHIESVLAALELEAAVGGGPMTVEKFATRYDFHAQTVKAAVRHGLVELKVVFRLTPAGEKMAKRRI